MKVLSISCLVIGFVITSALDVGKQIELVPKTDLLTFLSSGSEMYADLKHNAHSPEGRIFNGTEAQSKQFPFQAGLLIGFESFKYSLCGGTLIGNQWIVTAAHCTVGARTIKVKLGTINRFKPLVVAAGYENYIHKDYKFPYNDIALVKITKVDYNDYIAPATLPIRPQSSYVNSKGIISGWGLTNDDADAHSSKYLNFALVEITDNKDCEKIFGGKEDSMICVNTNSSGSACKGDSGGPLVLQNTKQLIGLCSFGHRKGCTKGFPNVYTNVSFYLDWIKNISSISG